MPRVTVNTPKVVNVRIDQKNQSVIKNSTTFVGASDVTARVEAAYNYANNALIVAHAAFDTANTKYDKVGGVISGDVIIEGDIFANVETIDGGEFL